MGCPLLMFWELFPFSKLILQQINFTHPGRQYILVLEVLFVCFEEMMSHAHGLKEGTQGQVKLQFWLA